jgi:hypothetical protein
MTFEPRSASCRSAPSSRTKKAGMTRHERAAEIERRVDGYREELGYRR